LHAAVSKILHSKKGAQNGLTLRQAVFARASDREPPSPTAAKYTLLLQRTTASKDAQNFPTLYKD